MSEIEPGMNFQEKDDWVLRQIQRKMKSVHRCRKCNGFIDPDLDEYERVLRIRGMASGSENDPMAVSEDDPTLCVDCEDSDT